MKDAEKNQFLFQHLQSQRHELEAAYGQPLAWEPLEDRRACRIAEYRPGSIEADPDTLEAHKQWGVQRLLKLKEVFGEKLG